MPSARLVPTSVATALAPVSAMLPALLADAISLPATSVPGAVTPVDVVSCNRPPGAATCAPAAIVMAPLGVASVVALVPPLLTKPAILMLPLVASVVAPDAVMLPVVWVIPPLPATRSSVAALALPDKAMPPVVLLAVNAIAPLAVAVPVTSIALVAAAVSVMVILVALSGPASVSAVLSTRLKAPPLTANLPSVATLLPDWSSTTLPMLPPVLCSVPAVMLPAVWAIPPLPAVRSSVAALAVPDNAMPPAALPAISAIVPLAVAVPVMSIALVAAAVSVMVTLLALSGPARVSAVLSTRVKAPPLTANLPNVVTLLPDWSSTTLPMLPPVLCSVPAVMLPADWVMPPLPAVRSTRPEVVASTVPDSVMPPAPGALRTIKPAAPLRRVPGTLMAAGAPERLVKTILSADRVPVTVSARLFASVNVPPDTAISPIEPTLFFVDVRSTAPAMPPELNSLPAMMAPPGCCTPPVPTERSIVPVGVAFSALDREKPPSWIAPPGPTASSLMRPPGPAVIPSNVVEMVPLSARSDTLSADNCEAMTPVLLTKVKLPPDTATEKMLPMAFPGALSTISPPPAPPKRVAAERLPTVWEMPPLPEVRIRLPTVVTVPDSASRPVLLNAARVTPEVAAIVPLNCNALSPGAPDWMKTEFAPIDPTTDNGAFWIRSKLPPGT